MGKYPNSDIHAKYSEWHWRLIERNPKYRRLYQGDVDRFWFEYDFKGAAVLAALDLKWDGAQDSGLTATTKGIYEWLRNHGCRVYTVFINREFTFFKVVDWEGNILPFEEMQFADWLLTFHVKTPVGGLV